MEMNRLKNLDYPLSPTWEKMSPLRRWAYVFFFLLLPITTLFQLVGCTEKNPNTAADSESYLLISNAQSVHDEAYDQFYPLLYERLQDPSFELTWQSGGDLFTQSTGLRFISEEEMDRIVREIDNHHYGFSSGNASTYLNALNECLDEAFTVQASPELFSHIVSEYIGSHPHLDESDIEALGVAVSSYRLSQESAMSDILSEYIGGGEQGVRDAIAADGLGFLLGGPPGAIACTAGYIVGKLLKNWWDDYEPHSEFLSRWDMWMQRYSSQLSRYVDRLPPTERRLLATGPDALGTPVFDDFLNYTMQLIDDADIQYTDVPLVYRNQIPEDYRPYWWDESRVDINWRYVGMVAGCFAIGFAAAYL